MMELVPTSQRWASSLPQVFDTPVGMLRGHPDLILDSCSVRAKRGGDLTGPNPTDRAKRGTKYRPITHPGILLAPGRPWGAGTPSRACEGARATRRGPAPSAGIYCPYTLQ